MLHRLQKSLEDHHQHEEERKEKESERERNKEGQKEINQGQAKHKIVVFVSSNAPTKKSRRRVSPNIDAVHVRFMGNFFRGEARASIGFSGSLPLIRAGNLATRSVTSFAFPPTAASEFSAAAVAPPKEILRSMKTKTKTKPNKRNTRQDSNPHHRLLIGTIFTY